MGELQAAQDELARRSNDELCAQYAHWMGSADSFSVGAEASTDWMPLTKLRYSRFQFRSQINQRSAWVWSPADLWLVTYFQQGTQRNRKTLHYAVYSQISKEPAGYFIYKEQAVLPQGRVTVGSASVARLPAVRGLGAVFNQDLCNLMENNPLTPVLTTENDYPLHQFIRTSFIV